MKTRFDWLVKLTADNVSNKTYVCRNREHADRVIDKLLHGNFVNGKIGLYLGCGLVEEWECDIQQEIHIILKEKIDDIFAEMQEKLGIENGDIWISDTIALDNSAWNLSNIIKTALVNQLES